MRTVAEITGQDRIARELSSILTSDQRTAAIIGPEGSGKSRTAALVGDLLSESFSVMIRSGEPLLQRTPEGMLLSLDGRLEVDKTSNAILDVAEDVAQLIEDGHIPFSRTLRRLLGFKRKKGRAKLLTPRQQQFIFQMAAKNDTKSTLLIADNLHYWDAESLTFLAQVQNGLWDDLYPGLKASRVVLAWTPSQAGADFDAEVSMLFGKSLPTRRLAHVTRDEFEKLYRALGGPSDAPKDAIEHAFAISGGHLLFVSQLVALLKDNDPNIAGALAKGDDLASALKNMLEARLEALGPASALLRRLLQALCVMGEGVRKDDLSCILPDAQDQLDALIEQAVGLGLVRTEHNATRVVHDIVRRVFLEFLTPDQLDWHARFAECLRRLRPSDYDRRAVHLSAAGNDDHAEVARVMSLLQAVRNLRIEPIENWSEIAGPLSDAHAQLVDAMRKATTREYARDYVGAVKTLDGAPLAVAAALSAERDYMLSRMLLLVRTRASHERALALLSDNASFREDEPELWARIEELKIVILSYLGELAEARQTESLLRAFYQERSGFDPLAPIGENRLRRKSESIHAPRIANDRLRRALLFFDPAGDGAAPRDAVEYLLTLNNLGSNELVIGEIETAYRHLTRCFEFIQRAEKPVVRRPELVFSNLVIAHHLLHGQTLSLLGDLKSLTDDVDTLTSDGSLVRSNIGALFVENGDLEAGTSILEAAASPLAAIENFSAYSVYFLFSNTAVARWLKASDHAPPFSRAESALGNLEPDLKPYATKRLAILENAFAVTSDRSLQHLQEAFLKIGPQVGEGWTLYGRPMALSDLQFWTES
jgi:hypothetical protein